MENNGEQWSETEQSGGKTRLDVSSSFITDGNEYGSICPWEEAESFFHQIQMRQCKGGGGGIY